MTLRHRLYLLLSGTLCVLLILVPSLPSRATAAACLLADGQVIVPYTSTSALPTPIQQPPTFTSPDGQYTVTFTVASIQLTQLGGRTLSLDVSAGTLSSDSVIFSWSADSQYFAVGLPSDPMAFFATYHIWSIPTQQWTIVQGSRLSWARQGHQLAYFRHDDSTDQLSLVITQFAQHDYQVAVLGAYPDSIEWSPSGDYLVAATWSGYHSGDGYTLVNLTSKQIGRYYFYNEENVYLDVGVWSSDGQAWIYLERAPQDVDGSRSYSLQAYDFRTDTITPLVANLRYAVASSHYVAFLYKGLQVIDVDTDRLVTLFTNDEHRYVDGLPAWSPDGNTIAFSVTTSGGLAPTTQEQLIWSTPDGSHQHNLIVHSDSPLPTGADESLVTWSPDSDLVIYADTAGAIVADRMTGQVIFATKSYLARAYLSPDRHTAAVITDTALYLVPISGQQSIPLQIKDIAGIVWSPDSQSIAVLWLVDASNPHSGRLSIFNVNGTQAWRIDLPSWTISSYTKLTWGACF